MDTKGPISPSSYRNSFVCVIVDAFTYYVLLHSSPKNDAANALNTLFEHWIVKFGRPDIIVTDNLKVNSHTFAVHTMYNLNHAHHMYHGQMD